MRFRNTLPTNRLTGELTMRKIVDSTDAEGLDALLGERVTLFCMNYFYTGVLTGVNATCVLLTDPAIIYETGSFADKAWKDAQPLGVKKLYVMIAAIESFGVIK